MFIDIWIVCLFSILFGICAVINYRLGVLRGIDATLTVLADDKIITIEDDKIVPYKNKKHIS